MGNLISSSANTITTTPQLVEPELANNIVNKQTQLISNLEDAIKQSRNALVIDVNQRTSPNTTPPIITQSNPSSTQSAGGSVSRFANVNPITDYYTPPFSLGVSKTPEVGDYINAYNQSIALLDDPNQLNQAKFDMYMHLQNKKINELQTAMATFPTNGNITNNPIKAIKNLSTSASLNVEEYPDPTNKNNTSQPTTYQGNGATAYPNYLIYGNNGCLKYNKSTSTATSNPNTSATWNFQACNSNDPAQRFNMKQINTLADYNDKITSPNNQSYKIRDTNSVIMGFYAVSPETASDQCIMLNNDGLSVMPCTMDSTQRFKPYYHNVNP